MSALALDYLPTWKGVGSCVSQPDALYPVGPEELKAARALCRRCPVLAECRDWVLGIPWHVGPDGVVAGMTGRERERIILGRMPPKWCRDCREVKPLYEFGVNTPGRAARRAICRSCETNRDPRSKRPEVDALPDEPVKTCPRCKTVRGHSRFYPNRRNHDGLSAWCRPCFLQLKGTQ